MKNNNTNIIKFEAKKDLVREIDELSKMEKKAKRLADISLGAAVLFLIQSLSVFGGAIVTNASLNIPTVVVSFTSLFVGLGLGSFSIMKNEEGKALTEEWIDLVGELNYIENEEERIRMTKEIMKNENMEKEFEDLYQDYYEDEYYQVQDKPKTLSKVRKFPKKF